MPEDSAYALQIKNFIEIALSRSLFRDKRVFAFYAQNQDGRQNGGKIFLRIVARKLCRYPVGQKFCQNRSISLRFRDKMRFCVLSTNSRWPAHFCILRRNSRWPPKVAGKQFLEKVTSRFCRYPMDQKFRRNCSISLRFRDK